MGNAVVHFEVIGQDGAKLRSFYGDLFDWRIDADNEMGYGIIDREDNLNADGVGIGGGIMGLPKEMVDAGETGHVTWYVEVADVAETLARVEALGGKRVRGPDEVPGGPILGSFVDPEGHFIGLMQRGS